jgi:hypothetical protein
VENEWLGNRVTSMAIEYPDQPTPRCQRWYDQRPLIRDAVTLVETYPGGVQNHITGGLVFVAEKRYDVESSFKSLRSLSQTVGIEAVQALYKAKNRQRSWDTVPNFHRMMNYWRVMPKDQQDAVATETFNICHWVSHYLTICQGANVPPQETELALIIKAQVTQGPKAAAMALYVIAKHYPSEIVDPVLASLNNAEVPAPPPATDHESLAPDQDDETGITRIAENGGDFKIRSQT